MRISSGRRGRGRSICTTSAMRPGRGLITATTSDRNAASEMAWVTISVVAGRSVQIRSSSMFSRCRVMSSSAPNGSSSSITVGCTARQRAMATRWRMPPDSCAGLAFSKPVRPTSSIRSGISPGSGLIPATSSGSRMFAITLRHGSRAASWKAMPSWWSRWMLPGGPAVDQRGARRRLLQPGQDAQDRRLAAAGRAEQRQERVRRRAQVVSTAPRPAAGPSRRSW